MNLNKNSKAKRILSKRGAISAFMVIAIAAIVIVASVATVVWILPMFQKTQTPNTPSSKILQPVTLTVVGSNGTTKTLKSSDITALAAVTGKAGFKSSGGAIANVGNYTGVSILTLCNLVGGIKSGDTLTVTASDGYSMVYTYAQVVNGQEFTTYDSVSGSEVEPTKPLTLTLNYFVDGKNLTSDVGPLRIGVVGSEGLLTEGHFWVKFVSNIAVTTSVKDWTVLVNATTSLNMTRQAFTAEINHFPLNWTDPSGNVWTGTALWRWVSWSNVNGGVSNDTLNAGYSVKVISGDGSSAVFADSRVKMNNNTIVAAKLNGADLSNPYWPLTLVGSNVSTQEMIKNILQIQIVTTQVNSSGWSIIVKGTIAENMSRATFESQVNQVSVSYTDSNGVWSGTPLHRLIMWCASVGGINGTALNSGYVVRIVGSDGHTIIMNDTRVNMNTHIMVANRVNDTVLSAPYYPLTLVGSDVSEKETVKGIAQIQIMLLPPLNLTLVGTSGQQVVLHAVDIANLTAYAANGGTRSSGGTLGNYGNYTGVPILTLLNLVGGITSSNTVRVIASDGYSTTYTYAQVNGQGIATYYSNGTQATSTQPLKMIVAYNMNDAGLASGLGPLRIAIIGSEGFYTTGSFWAKMAVKIQII